MTRTLTTAELDQRAQLAALMAPKPEQGIHPSELAPPGAHTLIRKTLIRRDRPEAREIDDATGSFEAVVSTWEVDRQNERFVPGAFRDTIDRWRASGKQLPVLYAHDAKDPSMLVGAIDPSAMHETSEGLHVKGRLDLEARRGQEVYGLLKRGAPLGWSVGFGILPENVVKEGARRILTKVAELLEVSLTPTPANAGTRTLAVKDIEVLGDEPDRPLSHTEIETMLIEQGIIAPVVGYDDVRSAAREHMTHILGDDPNGDEGRKAATPWIADPDDYTDSEWQAACVLDLAEGVQELATAPAKQRWRLPVRRPGATKPDPAGLAAAARRLVQGTATTDAKRAAATRLLAAYASIGREPLDRYLLGLAGKSTTTRTKATTPITIAEFAC